MVIGDIVAPIVGPRGEGYKGRRRELGVSLRDCARGFFPCIVLCSIATELYLNPVLCR